jgi:hypothetical protein
VTPPISINFRRQIEKQMSNYWLMGASSFKFKKKYMVLLIGGFCDTVKLILPCKNYNPQYKFSTLFTK